MASLFDNLGGSFSMNQLPLVGNFFANPNEARMKEQMHQAGVNYQAYRPEAAQARLNAMNQQMSLMQPVNNALSQMYGPQAMMDTTQASQNPMSNRMMGLGAPNGSPSVDGGKKMMAAMGPASMAKGGKGAKK